ncbi:FH1/FH2 domain-containing protein 3 [Trachymyrmex septentrionalis]|uniref:FH1/FH2 domain-containing protein 3 n=1 Tax=Trachymyrmex septentrionalis TaxID=34720 RepID=A0A195FIM0_9HYME|nr:FH1/FH2 domain-containing protein 3 [Trachymyrmex septentrionalis]
MVITENSLLYLNVVVDAVLPFFHQGDDGSRWTSVSEFRKSTELSDVHIRKNSRAREKLVEGDTGAYRSRPGVSIASTFGRNASGGSNLPSCRSSYSGVGSSSTRTVAKERALAGFGGTFLKKNKFEEKPAFKYSCTKNIDKSRLHSGRSSSEDVRAKSPLSDSRSSLLEKYSFSAGKTSERPSSVLDRYNRPASREKSREPEGISRYGASTYPGSSFGRSYGNDGRTEKKDHPPVSYRGLRPNSGKSASREPSPEVGVGKTNSFRVYSRAPSYSRSAASPNTSESSSTISTRFGSTAGSRFLSSRSSNERMSTTVNYSAGGRFRNLNNKTTNQKEEEEKEKSRFAMKSDNDSHYELSKTTNRIEENEINNKLPNNEFMTLTVVTRGTSPTPPASSSYVRNKRAEINVVQQNEVIKHRKLADTTDEEIQCDQMEEPSRFSRYGSSNRVSGVSWSTYLDKYSSASSTGNPSIYSSRGYTNASSSSNRLNNFAYKRMNEASKNESSVKELSSSNQEIHNFDNKSQNEKFFSDLSCTTNDETLLASNDLKTSSNCQNIHSINKEDRIHGSERCCCGARKTETNGSSNNLRSSNNQNLAFYRREDSITKNSQDASKCDEYNKKKPSISRLKHTSPKNEAKISKCSLKNEITSSKLNAYNERRGSTSKSDTNSSSREESLRVVEGHSQNQNEEVTSQKRDISQRKDSTSSGSSQSRSASTSQTRNIPTKNIPRQMTRTGSSDGSSVNMPIGRSKSSSASSVTSQSIKIKTTTPPSPGKSSTGSILSSVNLRQGGSPDARGKPPVPKNDTTTAATPKCTVAAKYVNKDFRKSTLNMENGDLSCSKYARRKKSQRNISISSQDSEMISDHIPQIVSSGSLTSTKSGQSRFRTPSAESKPMLSKNSSNGSTKWEELKSGSKSPCGIKKRPSGTFSSSTSSQSTSVNSSSSEDDNDHTDKTGSRRRRKRIKSPTREVKGKISAGSSRTSILASSADDMSMMTEKPPRPPSNPRSKSDRSAKTEEAKSFLMRALAPVTNFFKNKNQDSDDTNKSDGWVESFEENHEVNNKSGQQSSKSISQNLSKDPSFTNSQKNDDVRGNNIKVLHQSSGEKPWWLDSNSDNVPEGVQRASPWNNDISQDTTVSTALPDDGKYKLKIWRQGSEEYAWWLDDVTTEETKKSPVSSISRRGSSRGSSFRSADRRNRIRHQQSGERAWWMSDDPENVPEGIEVIPVAPADSQSTDNPVVNESIYSSKPLKKIRHIESGEKAWWMDSSSNVPDGVVRIPVEIPNSTSDSSESYEKIDIGINPEPETCVKRSLSRFPIEFPPPPSEPLGDRASPEGVENPPDPPDNYGGRKSPYDNVQSTPRRLPPRKRPSTLPLFIGEHTDINDVLGDTAMLCHSPVPSRVRKQERVEEDISENNSECEEIDATQVIIHDGTLKTPMIQRRNRDNRRIQPDGYIPYLNDVDPFSYPTLYPDVNPPDHTFSATLPLINQLAAVHRLLRAPHRLDDTALQLYKGGDYGAYLDLEASINEQQEEFEGFHEGESVRLVTKRRSRGGLILATSFSSQENPGGSLSLIFIAIDEFRVKNKRLEIVRLRFPVPEGALAANRLAVATLEVNRICMRVSPALLR